MRASLAIVKSTTPKNDPLGTYGTSRISAVALAILGSVVVLGWAAESPRDPALEWVAPARAARKANPVTADARTIAAGKELFVAACLPCHGQFGKGDGPAAATLEREGKPIRPGNLSSPKLWEQTDGTIFWKMSEGRTPMPSFESFPEELRWQIVDYVRTLAPKEPDQKKQTTTEGKK